MLSLPADKVPIVYRIRVSVAGEVIANSTTTQLESDMPKLMSKVELEYFHFHLGFRGEKSVKIEYWPA